MPAFVEISARSLRNRLRSESGIALPVAMMLLFVISGLSTVAVSAATTVAGQSLQDRGVKRALGGLDGGLQTALYRTNKVPHASNKCVTAGANGALTVSDSAADGWCTAQSEDLGDGESYTYRVSPGTTVVQNGQSLVQRKIVATGCVLAGATPAGCLAGGGVTRRAMTTVAAVNASLFGAGGVLSRETLTVENNAYVEAAVASNDDVVIQNNGEICGNVAYGPSSGDDFTEQNNAVYDCPATTATKAQQEFLLNPVDGSGARSTNDNGNLFAQDPMLGSATWDAANRVLRITNNSSVTLTGDTYSFCYLEIDNNAQLRIAPRAAGRPPLRIFIDRPENCAGAGLNKGNVSVQNNAAIVNETSDPAMLQLYVEGSTTTATSILFRNNSDAGADMHMVVYAPNSNLTVRNNGNFRGAMAGKRVTVENNGSLVWDPRSAVVTMSTSAVYQRRGWTECTADPTGSAPDSGC